MRRAGRLTQKLPAALLLAGALVLPVLGVGCASTTTQESLGEAVDDTVITGRVKAAFIADKTVDATRINIETFKGTVQLSGFAATPDEAAKAVELARKVPGVRAVRDDIRMRATNAN